MLNLSAVWLLGRDIPQAVAKQRLDIQRQVRAERQIWGVTSEGAARS